MMFNNLGGKIQSISKVFAWLGIIIGAILALLGISIVMEELKYEFVGNPALGFIYVVGGIFLALTTYLASLFLCAFGKMTEDISVIRNILQEDKIILSDETKLVENNEQLPQI